MLKVFYDQDSNRVYISGAFESVALNECTASLQGDDVSIFDDMLEEFLVKWLHYTEFRDRDGNGFSTPQECVDYLNSQLKGVSPWLVGGGGGGLL